LLVLIAVSLAIELLNLLQSVFTHTPLKPPVARLGKRAPQAARSLMQAFYDVIKIEALRLLSWRILWQLRNYSAAAAANLL
jgi:hypothetical protein